MNDETKDAIELWRETAKKPCRCLDCTAVRAILAHIDGEPARLAAAREEAIMAWRAGAADRDELRADCERRIAAAREEQREACARHAVAANAHRGTLWPVQFADTVRATPLTATPLADEIAALRAQNDELREHLREKESQRLSAHTENETLRARVAELEHALRDTSQAHVETGKLREEAEAERDALRAERDEVTMLLSGALHWTVASELMAANHTRAAHAVVDELAALRARVAELEAQVAAMEEYKQERDDVEVATQRLRFWAENPYACPVHFGARTACGQCYDSERALRLAAEAQVAAARAACARLVDRPWSRWAGDAARDVLRAMDEATKK